MKQEIKYFKPGWQIDIKLDTIRAQLVDELKGLGATGVQHRTPLETLLGIMEDYTGPFVQMQIERDASDLILSIRAVADLPGLEEAVREGEVLKVSDLSEVSDDRTGYVIEVTDHGNVTLYRCINGVLTEIWAVV